MNLYTKAYKDNSSKFKINMGVIILLGIVCVFSFRVFGILSANSERGGLAYVELLNFGMPLVENSVYDKEDYVQNKLSINKVLFEATGLSNLNFYEIINSEVSYLGIRQVANESNLTLNPFKINDTAVSKEDIAYDETLKKPLDNSKPEVLIYHTHTTESYAEDGPDSSNEEYNVVGVGDVIAEELETKYGISAIHDKTNHSVSYLNSYQRSNETVNRYLSKYGDFKLIIDLHRDSVDNKDATTATIDGQKMVKVMFVNTKNSTRYAKNKELTQAYYDKTNELFNGLTRDIFTYNSGKNAFNQGLSDNSILMEFGSNVNSSEEAKNTARCMARVIAEEINRK